MMMYDGMMYDDVESDEPMVMMMKCWSVVCSSSSVECGVYD